MIADIGIERLVIAAELPAGRDVDLVKIRFLRVQHTRHLCRSGIELEIPVPVQAQDLGRSVALLFGRHGVRLRPVRIRNKIAARRHLIDLEDLKCVVVVLIDLIFHNCTLSAPVCAMQSHVFLKFPLCFVRVRSEPGIRAEHRSQQVPQVRIRYIRKCIFIKSERRLLPGKD